MARRVRKADGVGGACQGSLPLLAVKVEREDRSGYPECVLCGMVEPVGNKVYSGKYDGSVHLNCYEKVEGMS